MNFSKLFQPKLNPFRLFIYSQKEGTITLKTFSPEKMTSSKLSNLNPGFTYCNSYNDLFVSEGNDFWIINHTSFQIRYKKMPIKKNNHSLIFVPCPNCQSGEGKIFIVGGENKKSFYFDLKKNYFINWAETNELHKNPALIKIGDYLYIFDSGKNNKLIFERTKLTDNKKQWEKIIPNYDENIIKYFPSENFAASLDSNGRVIFIGGNNINMENNNTFIYDINQNKIYLSEKGTNDNMNFVDKTFYFIDNQYNVALPEELEESREIAFVDKREQSLIRTNIGEIVQSIIKDKSDYKQKNLLQFFKRDKNEENNKNQIVKNYNTPKEFGYCVSYYSYEKAKIKAKNDNIKVIEVQKNIATIPKDDLKVEIEKELKELKEIKENIKKEENYIDNKIEEQNVEQKEEENVEKKVEENVEQNIEQKVEENIEQKAEENVEQNIVENAEQKVEENIEQNVEQNIEENVEQKVEENVEQNIEENAEQKQEENVEHNVEENIEQNVEQKVEPEIENNIEQNAEQNYEPNIEKIELPEQIEQNNAENIENKNEENILESKEEEHFEQVQENQETKKEQEEPIQVKENEKEQEPLQEKQEEQEHIPEQENINQIPLEEVNTDINQNAENIKQEEQNIEHEEEHYEEHIEQKEENENQEENEEHVEEHVEENIEEHVEEHVEEHLEEHDEQVEQKPEEENVEEHYEEEHNEEHYEQQIDANENQQVPEHENIENGGENEEEHIEQQDNNLIHEEENIEMKENLNQQAEDINIKPEEEEHQHEEPQEQIEEHQEIHENENEQNPNPEEVQEQYQENQNEVDIEKLNKHLDDIIERKIKEEIKPIEALIETKVEEDPNKVSIKKEENIDIIEEDAKVHIQMQNQLEFNNDQIQTESHHENENAENVENEEHFDSQGEENAEEEHQENIEEMEEMNFEEENNEEDNNEYGEEEQVEERDTFQKTLTQSIGEDVMQIPEQPIQIYYDAENFCDYTP